MVSYAQARAMDPNYNAAESSYAWIVKFVTCEVKNGRRCER